MRDTFKVQFIIQPHFSLLAFTAAADALTTANLVQRDKRFTFETIGLTTSPVVSDLGIQITADIPIQKSNPASADVVIVCGGYRCSVIENRKTSKFLTKADRAGVFLGGLWNGCLALAHAKLMEGYACALHPDNHSEAGLRFPNMTIRPEALVVDRTRLSAAGPNSSFDLMLLLIQRQGGSATTTAIRNILRADISQIADPTDANSGDNTTELPEKLQRAIQLMRNNLDEPLSRREMATQLGMSTRAMERLFEKHIHTSPARQYLELRLVRAHEMLRQSKDSVGRIADNCGFVSSAHFSRAFSKRFGCSPKSLRQSSAQLIDSP